MNRDSGRYRGKRRIQGGRVEVRAPLFLACPTAIRHNTPLRRLYRRLRDAGKPARLALVAVMRKVSGVKLFLVPSAIRTGYLKRL